MRAFFAGAARLATVFFTESYIGEILRQGGGVRKLLKAKRGDGKQQPAG